MVVVFARNWWALVLRGLVSVIFGIMAFAWPGITLTALVLLYGAYALVDGVFAITAAMVGRTQDMPWWALLIDGILGIGVGIITFAWPGITGLVLLYLISAWAVVTGIFEIVAAIRLRREIRGEWLLGLSGIVSVLFGLALVVNPIGGLVAIAWMIGAYAIIFGVLSISLGFRLRKVLKSVSSTGKLPSGEPAKVDVNRSVGTSR